MATMAPVTRALCSTRAATVQAASRRVPDLQRLRRTRRTRPRASARARRASPIGDAKRIFRGIELVARKQFTNELWAQASFLYSSLTRQLLRRHPRGHGPDGPRHQRRLRLLPVHSSTPTATSSSTGRSRPASTRCTTPLRPLGRAAQFYVRSGLPTLASRLLQQLLPDRALPRASAATLGRTPTDYEMNLSARLQPQRRAGDDHAAALPFNVLNNQTVDGLRPDVQPGRRRS